MVAVPSMLRCLALLALSTAVQAACSPAENKCGEMCCCVTCKCLENPYSCEDMWGKPTDPVGYSHDERWVDPAWLENHHREQMALAEQHRQEHLERMREMEANMSPEEKAKREKQMEKHRRRMQRHAKGGKFAGSLKGMEGMEDEDDEDDAAFGFDASDGASKVDEMRSRMEKRMQESIGRHRRMARDEREL
ncbi:hypothetical protein AB1Y20_005073 [Prymnesium parvum]|uniref:Uncharacterized protein n=1 Tax=Prymnesium parvum TaxID=97485 RepID=A0AB34J367_PRYPA|mmetsp:Transcript_21201/g.50908  ORF Transcript_21201/g.50908 Transcript_21201/m.50908 type:complete len:192 (+) Transcript_21201:3-578(+)